MLKVLVKKQLSEVFRSYFYDAKKNKMRSKGAIAAWFVFFAVVMVGVLGGMFTAMSLSLCVPLHAADMGWLYYLLMSLIAVMLGAFGSVFNTYSGLYLAKDNDLLLSMPIPVRTIVAARLVNVYLLGALYSVVVILPAVIVGWVTVPLTAGRIVCGFLLLLIVTGIVLLLSCLLGWVVAKISRRLKNKSYITVLISLVCIGLYYFIYFKARDLIAVLVQNAAEYGARIRGAAGVLYFFGSIGEGNWLAAAAFLVATIALLAALWRLLARSFLGIAAGGGEGVKVRYVEKSAKAKRPYAALLGKELRRFTASPGYMLNCGLGLLLLPAAGVALILRGRMLCDAIDSVLSGRPGSAAVIVCTVLCLVACMNDMAAPAVSLEGRSLWIPQSLPVLPKTVLRAKAGMQLVLTLPAAFIAAVGGAIAVPATASVRIALFFAVLLFTVFLALVNAAIGVKMPVLNWTNELSPIKQSGAVMLAMLGGWALCAVLGGVYLLIGYRLGAAAYLLLWCVLCAAVSLLLLRWLDKKGAKIFAAL